MQVLEFLKERPVEDLSAEFGIGAKWKDDLVILNYDMIDSIPFKTHPIVRECRGLVLRKVGDGFVVAQMPFRRFFNLMESEDSELFNWYDFSTEEKLDGSMIKVTGVGQDLLITTRNSFADSEMGFSGRTWAEAVSSLLTQHQTAIILGNPHITFVFELCTPWNVVVVPHSVPKIYLIGLFYHEKWKEADHTAESIRRHFLRPATFSFSSMEEIHGHLARMRDAKDVAEGFVLKDCNDLRLKVKNEFHLELHRLSNNGNIASTKSLVSVVCKGEEEEVGLYFPHLKDKLTEVKAAVEDEFSELFQFFISKDLRDIEDQKAFAHEVVGKTPYSHVLFQWKKSRPKGLWAVFLEDESIILDRVTSRLGE